MLISSVPEELCLNFANTMAWRGTSPPVESLGRFSDLLAWLKGSGAVVAGTADSLLRAAASDSARAAAFAEAIELRETIYRIFSAVAVGGASARADTAILAQALVAAPARTDLALLDDGRCAWRIEPPILATAILAPVLWSAGDLVLAAPRRRIRQCANEKCLWLFLDESKNGTRRWCDMSSCGNRAKAHRHYSKIKKS